MDGLGLSKVLPAPETRNQILRFVLLGMVLLLVFVRLDLAVRFEINWDEFLNLSTVYDHLAGTLQQSLQVVYVYLFTWVPSVSPNEVDQVIAARLLVLAFAALTSLAIYVIARDLVSVNAALLAVVAFNGFSFVMRHGGALRTDPLAVCASMLAVAIAVADSFSLRRALALGALFGIATALTIKAALYVPLIGAILLVRVWYAGDPKQTFGLVLLSGATAVISFLVIIGLHTSTLPAHGSPSAYVARASGELLFSGDYEIFRASYRTALIDNFAFWVLVVLGLARGIVLASNPEQRRSGLMLLCLSLMLLTPLIYRDTYPYYYIFMIAPAAILVGAGFAWISDLRKGVYGVLALAFLTVSVAKTYTVSLRQDNREQHLMLATIHQLFPKPVPYIDHTAMVSSFPKKGIFMSVWGIRDYRRAGKAIMPAIIEKDQPKFLLATRFLLDIDRLIPELSEAQDYGLFAEDIRALKANYLKYWGPLYLPGMILVGDTRRQVNIAGRYRVSANMMIEDQSLDAGAAIDLATGEHHFRASEPVALYWDAPPPPRDTPPRRLFNGF